MVDRFPNLPGVVANIVDGNLAPEIPASGPVTVIIGTGSTGPSGRLATVNGAGGAARTYGSGSLMRGAVEAFQGGAESVSGFRILPTPGRIDGIGGGLSLHTLAAGADALSDIELLYDGTILKTYDRASGALTFASDGSADLGIVTTTGALAGGQFISAEITGHGGNDTPGYTDTGAGGPSLTFDGSFIAATLGAVEADGSGDAYIVVEKLDGTSIQALIAAVANQVVTLTADLPATANGADPAKCKFYSRSAPVSVEAAIAARLGNAANRDLSVLDGSNVNGQRLQTVTDASGKLNSEDAEVSPSKNNIYEGLAAAAEAMEGSEIDYITVMDGFLDDTHAKDTAPADVIAEGDILETQVAAAPANQAFISGGAAALNAAIVAAGRGGSWLVIHSTKDATFGDNHDSDKLVRCGRILNWELVGNHTRVFLDRDLSWSVNGSGALTAVKPALVSVVADSALFFYREAEEAKLWFPTSVDPDGKVFHEVNFGYKIASICEDKTTNESFCMGVIGVNPPSSHFAPASISTWVGTAPEVNLDSGLPSSTGTGLLGQKLLAGKSGFTPGFFATSNGYMDDSSVLLDENDSKIDMGKFLSIVASHVLVTNLADTDGLGYICSAAGLYTGQLSALPPWSAATGKSLTANASLPSRLSKRRQNALAGLGYVVLDQPRGANVTVVDAPSAAMSASDFTRNMTARMVGEAIARVRAVGRPFLGEPLSAPRKAALDSAIGSALGQLQSDSDAALESFDYSITQTPREAVTGVANLTLSLKVIGELRRIIVTVSLSL